MKLDYLKIPNWRNLRQFEINFDETEPVVAILGQNGTGKSNLVEALVRIFRELDNGRSTDFAFELGYISEDTTGAHKVAVAGNGSEDKLPAISIDGKTISAKEWKQSQDRYLPSSVFAYYSGSNQRLEREFVEPLKEHYKRWFHKASNTETVPVRRFFYSRREYAPLVMLAFFLSDDARSRKVLSEFLHIDGFDSALITLRRPWWASARPSKVLKEEGDPRFWYARGAFLPFLDRLWNQALAPFRSEGRMEVDFRGRSEECEQVYLYIKNEQRLNELRWPGENELKIFAFLEALELCGLLDMESTKVKVRHRSGKIISFDHFSEGEQQLVMVLGLMIFNRREQSLFLLDEPDTHLNPQWTYQYFDLVKKCFPEKSSHLLIATHNPLMIGSLRRNQVRVLVPSATTAADGSETFVTKGIEPEVDPVGMGVDGLLLSEFFGLRSTLSAEVIQKLDVRATLLAVDTRTKKQEKELTVLSDELAQLGIALTHPNPYFDSFSKALARNPLFTKPVLTVSESKQLDLDTDALLNEILSEDQRS